MDAIYFIKSSGKKIINTFSKEERNEPDSSVICCDELFIFCILGNYKNRNNLSLCI